MSKGRKEISHIERDVTHDALYACAKNMSSEDPAVTFIDALLTENEKMVIGRRILIAQMILSGKTRMEICGTLQVSPNTVALTRQWLTEIMPNYNETVAKREEIATKKRSSREQKRKSIREFVDPMSFKGMRKKFPAHFLLFNVAEELLNRLGK